MALTFIGSEKPTIGIEIELQIIDPITLDLTPKSKLFLEKCSPEDLQRIKAELHQSMLEIDTEIADSVPQCRAFLKSRMQRLHNIAKELNVKLAVAGTHPFQRWPDRLITKHDRYQKLHQKYQWLIQRMNVYGLHTHVGVKNGEMALAISNELIQYLPHLLALSANSPYWQGIDTGMQSCRSNIMDSFPYGGIPPIFQSWAEFEHYYDTLRKAGAIHSMKDLYWHIRPNLAYGTLEFRICDVMPSIEETMAVVALTQCLVVFASERIEKNPHEKAWSKELLWIAPENQWNAARYGLDAIIVTPTGQKEKITDLLLQLVKALTPTAKKLHCLEELQHIQLMIAQGNSAKRQRDLFQKTDSLQSIVAASIKEFESISK